jgi:hypothetical protein
MLGCDCQSAASDGSINVDDSVAYFDSSYMLLYTEGYSENTELLLDPFSRSPASSGEAFLLRVHEFDKLESDFHA